MNLMVSLLMVITTMTMILTFKLMMKNTTLMLEWKIMETDSNSMM